MYKYDDLRLILSILVRGRIHEIKKGSVFNAKIERCTTHGTEIGAENRPF